MSKSVVCAANDMNLVVVAFSLIELVCDLSAHHCCIVHPKYCLMFFFNHNTHCNNSSCSCEYLFRAKTSGVICITFSVHVSSDFLKSLLLSVPTGSESDSWLTHTFTNSSVQNVSLKEHLLYHLLGPLGPFCNVSAWN